MPAQWRVGHALQQIEAHTALVLVNTRRVEHDARWGCLCCSGRCSPARRMPTLQGGGLQHLSSVYASPTLRITKVTRASLYRRLSRINLKKVSRKVSQNGGSESSFGQTALPVTLFVTATCQFFPI